MDDCGWCVPMNVENWRGDNPQSYHPFRSLVLNSWTHDPLEFHMISPKKHWINIRMSVTFCHCPHILEVRSSLPSPSRKHTESSTSQLCAWGVQPPLPQWKVSPKLSPPRMGIALNCHGLGPGDASSLLSVLLSGSQPESLPIRFCSFKGMLQDAWGPLLFYTLLHFIES